MVGISVGDRAMSGPGFASWLARGPATVLLGAPQRSARGPWPTRCMVPPPCHRVLGAILVDSVEARNTHLPSGALTDAPLNTVSRRATAGEDRRQAGLPIEEVVR